MGSGAGSDGEGRGGEERGSGSEGDGCCSDVSLSELVAGFRESLVRERVRGGERGKEGCARNMGGKDKSKVIHNRAIGGQ